MNALPKPKRDRRLYIAAALGLLGLCVICGVVNSIRGATAPKPTPDVAAIYTSAAATVLASRPTATFTPAATATAASSPTPDDTATPEPTATATLTAAQRKSQYNLMDVRELVTYPNNHIGEKVGVWGEIFNINSDTELQIWAQGGSDAVYVVMTDPFSGIYEHDVISVYGTIAGENCGKNSFGAEICQPLLIDAFYTKP